QSKSTVATDLTTTGGGAITAGTTESLAVAGGTAYGWDYSTPYMIQMRMTSPYNILKSLNSLNSGTVSEPNWVSMFDNMYQYYQCKETDWGVKISLGQPRIT